LATSVVEAISVICNIRHGGKMIFEAIDQRMECIGNKEDERERERERF
jgi:hypothetical protein